jgi:hypothetical protein
MKSALSSKEILKQSAITGSAVAYGVFAQPITPHAMRAPESPDGWVFRSSGFAWTTTERPIADFASSMREI